MIVVNSFRVRQVMLSYPRLFRFPAAPKSKISLSTSPAVKMADETQPMKILEKNADTADKLIDEINAKVNAIKGKMAVEGNNLEQEKERVREEIKQYQQYLTLLQIRNGKLYVPSPKASAVQASGGSGDNAAPKHITTAPTAPAEKKAEESNPTPVVGDNTGKPAEPTGEPQNKKNVPKKESGGGGAKPKGQALPAAEEVVDVGRLDFRIGKIVEVGRHPDADTLYVEKIDVGEANPRTVVSGLVKHVPIEEMQDRMVVLLCNLKPAKMRGVTSEAMVMCASSPEKVEILVPPNGVVPGELIEFNGISRNADPVLNPKKKIFETVAPDLKTNDDKVATYKGIPFEVKGKGVVTSPSLVNVNIK